MHARAFGLALDLEFQLPGLVNDEVLVDTASTRLRLATSRELSNWWGRPDRTVELWATRFPGGEQVTVVERRDGAQLITFGACAIFGVTPSAAEVLCAPRHRTDVRWCRFLLDTVLWRLASARGFFLLHAAAVSGSHGTVAIASQSGGGKTTLALEFLRRGWRLLSDDVVALETDGQTVRSHPGPRLMNVAEALDVPGSIGKPIAVIDGESWLEVERAEPRSGPLRAVVLYSRAADLPLEVRRIDSTPIDLAPHVWDVGRDAARIRDRFNFLADLVELTEVFKLEAPLTAPPTAIADTLSAALAQAGLVAQPAP